MQITGKISYQLEVSHAELNLIGLALCGRLKPEQEQEANELNIKLLEQKEAFLKGHLKMVQNALESL